MGLYCTTCKISQKKSYYHVNKSTFFEHYREMHQEKFKDYLVVQCPMCAKAFNSVKATETHLRCRHDNNLTRNIFKELCEHIHQTADLTNELKWLQPQWTTKLREVECFASLTHRIMDCFTCPYSAKQNKNKIRTDPPKPQIEDYPDDKMTQFNSPNTCPCHKSVTFQDLDPNTYPKKYIKIGKSNRFHSAYLDENNERKERKHWEYC